MGLGLMRYPSREFVCISKASPPLIICIFCGGRHRSELRGLLVLAGRFEMSCIVLTAAVLSASTDLCPAFAGWHDEGSFLALDDGREPWHGSKRAPASPTSDKFLQLQYGEDLQSRCNGRGRSRLRGMR